MNFAEAIASANYDESKVGQYTLPDPLICQDGTRVTTEAQWREKRRPELLRLFEEHVYGKMFPPLPIAARVVEESKDAIGGKARRRQVEITFPGHAGPTFHLLLYMPNRMAKPTPCFVGLNFYGNHTVTSEPEVPISTQWMRHDGDGKGIVNHRATEASRGTNTHRWPFEMMIDRGYSVATVYCGDIDPDYDHGFTQGVHPMFRDTGTPRRSDEAGSITAWAWGLSRVLDYLLTVDRIDSKRIGVVGLSRLGKTALWAGACDERFAFAISNHSGCGGAALSRRNFGETLPIITGMRGFWFCPKLREHAANLNSLPVDQHMLVALMAPRPVLVCSAEDDLWADPRGEFLSCVHAAPVYRMLRIDGMDNSYPIERPRVNEPILSRVGYAIRPGKHDMVPTDWITRMDFADKHMSGR